MALEQLWNYIVIIVLILYTILGFVFLADFKKRKFPNDFLKSIYWAVIFFPPIFGSLFYYFFIKKPNRYAAENRDVFK